MRPEANKAVVFELIDAILRSWWVVVAGLCLGLAAAIAMLANTTKTYEAKAKILITPQLVKKQTTILTDDPTRDILALEEAVITNSSMRQLVEDVYGLPETEEQIATMIRGIRARLQIRPTATTIRNGWLAFDLVFRSRNSEHAALVVNSIAELYILQARDTRVTRSRKISKNREQAVESSREEFEEIDRELQAYLTEHGFETERHMDANLRFLENSQRDLDNLTSSVTLIKSTLTQLKKRRAEVAGGQLSAGVTLATLQAELDALLVSYSESHPNVIRKRRQIEEFKLEMANAESRSSLSEARVSNPELTALDQEIAGSNHELVVLNRQAQTLQSKIAEYERRIQAVAQVQPRLNQLESRHKNALNKLDRHQANLEQARESQALEEGEQAAQLELAEPAVAPRSPVYPIPQRFYALGVIGGLLVFVGPVLAFRFLTPLVSSEAGLKNLTDIPVLVSIPRIQTPAYRGYWVRRLAKNLGLATACMATLIAVKMLLG